MDEKEINTNLKSCLKSPRFTVKKGGERMVQEQVFLKGAGVTLFLFNFFKVYHFYIRKTFFSVTIIL